ncbi:AraC family transcriptional regulator [Saccharibacillus alkalitolerans]|uniref:AraC family transcriptional regulator n=1 Tax=Saccharibacillus alkalitolerans TaxID=2705290 RepID=A0ABX0FDP5_9BACL|nr:AraC family transcriptional regulator [Saccharibacillus alkalitolerans]NGZ77909.1 AraC family transcriptional regulator [Saccharibacillus alkalitolerans]
MPIDTDDMKEDHHEYLRVHFFTPSEYEKSGPAWPIRIGSNLAKPGYRIGPRTTAYYYLLLVLEGRGTFAQNGRTYPLAAGGMYCLFPQVMHEYWTDPDEPLRKIFLAFDGRMSLELLRRIGLTPARPHVASARAEEAAAGMRSFLNRAAAEGPDLSDLDRLAEFYRIFASLERAALPESGEPDGISWLQRGLEYMEIHYAEGITVEDVARHAGVGRTYFSKKFHERYGHTPVRHMQRLKLDEARMLLEQTNYSLSEIAHSVGYPDLFSFSKAFKKHTGLPPRQYRQQRPPS